MTIENDDLDPNAGQDDDQNLDDQNDEGQGDDEGQGQDDDKGGKPSDLLDPDAALAASDKLIPAKDAASWREKFGSDEKTTKALGRYNSPEDFMKAHHELRGKLSQAEAGNAPKPEKEKALAAWREERGIPDTTEGYLENLGLPEGVVLGGADEPIMAAVAAVALESDIPAEQFQKLSNAMFAERQVEAQRIYDLNEATQVSSRDELAQQHGAGVSAVVNNANAALENLFGDNADRIKGLRFEDGTMAFSHAFVVNAFDKATREGNPAATVIPGSTGGAADVNARLKELDAEMSTDLKAFRADSDKSDEYDKLLEIKEKLG